MVCKIIAIDTATSTGSVAILDKGAVLASEMYKAETSHSETLISVIEKVLKKADLNIKEMEAVAVSIGPGSFTGLRVGLATAKGLALSLGIPVVGVPTLKAIALSFANKANHIISSVPIKRDERFVSVFSKDLSVEEVKEQVYTKEELERLIEKYGNDFCLCDDGRDIVAENIGRLGFAKLESQGGDDISSLIPNYARKSEAEVKRLLYSSK